MIFLAPRKREVLVKVADLLGQKPLHKKERGESYKPCRIILAPIFAVSLVSNTLVWAIVSAHSLPPSRSLLATLHLLHNFLHFNN